VTTDSGHPILRLSIESPHAGRLVVLEFIEWVAVGADTRCRVNIVPCDSRGQPTGGPQTVVLDLDADELAYATHNTREAIEGDRVVLLECSPCLGTVEPGSSSSAPPVG